MRFECISINGFAGDRTPEAMQECHGFAKSFANHFCLPFKLIGQPEATQDLPWKQALRESAPTFNNAIEHIERIFDAEHCPILITPRCATAIASLPIIVSRHPDTLVLYFDAHGDLNTPNTSETGYLGGMPITAALGEWDSGYGSGLTPNNLVHIGGRDFDAAEQTFIEQNNVMTLSKDQIENNIGILISAIKDRPVYIHLDTDVFDPSEVTAEYAVDNGLYRKHVKSVVNTVLEYGHLIGLEITELSPRNDKDRTQSYAALFESFRGLKTFKV